MMRVLSIASEAFPLIKTGGLADVAGALPLVLPREGVEMRTLLPGYPAVMAKLRCPLRPASMTLDRSRPEILTPPEHPPACCTQQTLT